MSGLGTFLPFPDIENQQLSMAALEQLEIKLENLTA